MKTPSALVPSAMVAVMALVAVLPWGLPAESRFVLPFMPLIAIHHGAMDGRGRLPSWAVFAAGLTVDILSAGPLGYWSLIYLLAYALAVGTAGGDRVSFEARWLTFPVHLALIAVIAWAVASLYYLEPADWRPYLWAALMTALACPLAAIVLRLLDPAPPRRANQRLERGV